MTRIIFITLISFMATSFISCPIDQKIKVLCNGELYANPSQKKSTTSKSKNQSKKKKKKKKKKYSRRKRASNMLLKAGHPAVEITIKTDPRVSARVYHGKEFLGKTPLVLKWAKDTGALDLVLRAEGYINVNSRVYTYRNDRVTVKMFKKDQSYLLFGYKKKVKPDEEKIEEE